MIVAVDSRWAIGNKGRLLVSIPADLRRFRDLTTGKTVILGRKTLETFPSGRPLKNRRNIVLTHDKSFKVPDAEVVHDLNSLFDVIKGTDSDDIFVIGGSSVYLQLLPYCDVAYVTKIDYRYEADAFMPNLDEDPEWKCVDESEEQTCYDLIYTYCRYEKRSREN